MALIDFGFPGSYSKIESVTVDLKNKSIVVDVVTYDSAAKAVPVQAVSPRFLARKVTPFLGKSDVIPEVAGLWILKQPTGEYQPLQVVSVIEDIIERGPNGEKVIVGQKTVWEQQPLQALPDLIVLPDNTLWERDPRTEEVRPISRKDALTTSDFDELFSVAEMDKPGKNIVKQAYKLLKKMRLFSAAGSDAVE